MGKKLSHLILFLMLGTFVNAQKNITGKVTGTDNQPLVGVTVNLKNSTTSATSNETGVFSITVPQNGNSILVFTYVGYETSEQAVKNNAVININLKAVTSVLNEVVVIGYGTQRKVNLSGSVAVVSGKDLVNRPVPNLTGALQGVLPGVTVLRGSGKPGAEDYGIRIRGFSSAVAVHWCLLTELNRI